MQNTERWGFSCLFVMACLFYLSPEVLAKPSIRDSQQQLSQLRKHIDEIQQRIGLTEQQESSALGVIRALDLKLGEVGKQVFQVKNKIAENTQAISHLDNKKRQTQSDLDKQKRVLQQVFQSAYLNVAQKQIKLILNQNDMSKFSRNLNYYRHISDSQIKKLTYFREMVKSYDEIMRQLVAAESFQQKLYDELSVKQLRFEKIRHNQQAKVAEVQQQLQQQSKRLDALQKDEAKLLELINLLQETLVDIAEDLSATESFQQARGKLPWPVKGDVVEYFGEPKGAGTWEGYLLKTKPSETVRAIHNGRVVYADWLRGLGLLMIVDHGGQFMSLYGHNQVLHKTVGDWVEKGDTLSLSGRSGGQDFDALYFAIRADGKPVSPKYWLKPLE
jgi:murein hydrolase activator